jgi:hypothetical protein
VKFTDLVAHYLLSKESVFMRKTGFLFLLVSPLWLLNLVKTYTLLCFSTLSETLLSTMACYFGLRSFHTDHRYIFGRNMTSTDIEIDTNKQQPTPKDERRNGGVINKLNCFACFGKHAWRTNSSCAPPPPLRKLIN